MKPRGLTGKLLLRWICSGLALACTSGYGANPQAEALIAQGDAEVKALHGTEALALFDQAAKADPDDLGILLRVSQQCSNLISQAKTSTESLAFANRSLDDAKKAEDLAPDNPKAHLAVAVAYGRLCDFVDNKTKVEYSRFVKIEADKTLDLDPKEDFAYHVLGRWNYSVATLGSMMKLIAKWVYGGMPDASLDEAEKDFKKAIEIAPQRVIHHHELARVYVAMGRPDEARKEWQKELALQPEDNEGIADQKEARAELEK